MEPPSFSKGWKLCYTLTKPCILVVHILAMVIDGVINLFLIVSQGSLEKGLNLLVLSTKEVIFANK